MVFGSFCCCYITHKLPFAKQDEFKLAARVEFSLFFALHKILQRRGKLSSKVGRGGKGLYASRDRKQKQQEGEKVKMVNVVIRAKKPVVKENSRGMRIALNYLHRETDMYLRFSSTDLSDIEFCKTYANRQYWKLIVSPRKAVDPEQLLEKTIEGIEKFNRASQTKYIAYWHMDTQHPHLHFIICPSPNNKKFDLSISFITNYLYPYLNRWLGEVFGKVSLEVEKEEYELSINNIGQSRIDYDIKRCCDKDKTGQYLVYSKEKEKKKIDSWKLPFIDQRIGVLKQDGLCKIIGKDVVFLKDFIFQKVVKGKLYNHNLTEEERKKIKAQNVRQEDIKRILSEVKCKHITSMVVENKQGQLCYLEKKERRGK